MIFRTGLLISTALIVLTPGSAYASLVGPGRTVQAFYYNGILADPEGEVPVGAGSDDPASLASPVMYMEGSADLSLISVGNTQIVITNLDSGFPFCVTNERGTACPDAIDGFDLKFTGEDIIGVTVASATPADFLPVSGTFQGNTHLGLQLISPNEIRVDVTGDEPLLDDELILDVETAPEPSTLLLCAPLAFGLLIRRTLLRQRPSPTEPQV